ncbi:IS3 family transposase [Rhodococcus pyridinivorans]|uniref:IS3 family transposase n=1 Tax=Nocardiaceae TaxID=85025 RepID=UPI000C7B5578|nr:MULTISPECIES: IS3 family transposase [Nocardiaceae]AUM18153.1 IS3 family transposase [Rhodococcus ruber]AUM19308.1 IS3 family transposase [Rhodococcus ruber]AYA27422.1 IS3 family transposase [Rhodococcus rhodochrous]MBF6290208.1 IS3 family transposase [Nocardia cyriacigeorgica]MCT7294383.1 IS3 family transposase [Rhodococcus sp. PAE-6]
MARKNYTDEFRRRAVDLYESTPGATLKGIAADLGVSRGALKEWVDKLGSGTMTAGAAPVAPSRGRPESQTARIARLESENAALRVEQAKLAEERDILRQAAKYFGRGDELVNRFQFVEDHKDAWGVKRLCEVIEIARSSFYAWLAAAPGRAARQAEDAALAERIRVLQDPALGGDRASGAPRITADLNEGAAADGRVNHKRVARVMREHGLAGVRLRRRVRTTIPDQSGRRFPDLIGRNFSAGEPNRRYVGDITYLPVEGGTNLYFASCIDLGSRKLTGWAMADHMRTELVEGALEAARRERGSLTGSVFHSDHGSVYTSKAYAALCEQLGVTQSMGAIGSSADNALAESFNATLKRELLEGRSAFPDAATAYRAVFRWANRYNTRRRHSAIGNISPNAYEAAASATLAEAA